MIFEEQRNPVCQLFNIRYPIIQGGMVWVSGWKLASAVSNCGGLGLIGAGSMHPELLKTHIQKCKQATTLPFGVNVPLLYPQIDELLDIVIAEHVPIVFTSAGNPALYTAKLKEAGIKVVHVVSSLRFALKAQECGVDAIVAEGFEAGGHNGRDETTTMVLISSIAGKISIPLIAAGGIGTGAQILAAMALGAVGVQLGTRFALSKESSAHELFKQACIQAKEGDTIFTLKKLAPVRLLKNQFYHEIEKLDEQGAALELYKTLLGKGRAKLGILEGDLKEGELEIGQITALIDEVKPVSQIIESLLLEYKTAFNELKAVL
jgi:enoyl-[acyl-carrier protein] reductase II